MLKSMWTAAVLLLVVGIGMSLGLLVAPRSGEATRKQLQDRGTDLLKNSGRYYSARKGKLEEHMESLSDQARQQMHNLRRAA